MANNLYTTKTAALKATKADINNLNVKKLFLGGENILDIIKRATPTIKHSQDTRVTITENDLWGQYIETKSDGTIIVHDDWVTNPNASNYSGWNSSITNVNKNKAHTSSGFYANIQTEKIKDGNYMFYGCANLQSFYADLSSLSNGSRMFCNCSKLYHISSPDYSELNLNSLIDGSDMFYECSQLTSFDADLSSLIDGSNMFSNCTQLKSIYSDLSSLSNGERMFYYCNALTTVPSDLHNLKNGNGMFIQCDNLTSFNADLSSLSKGSYMFESCNKLTSFTSTLSSLTDGERMFYYCNALNTFTSDLSSLINGTGMFAGCPNLTSFNAVLSSLINGNGMFDNSKLSPQSVMYIADSIIDIDAEKRLYSSGTIPYATLSSLANKSGGFTGAADYVFKDSPHTITINSSYVGKLTLGINVTNNSSTIQQQLEDFAKEATFDSWSDLKTYFSNKGWTVTFKYGESNESITYGLRGGEQIIPCPIFAKLIEADKDSAEYCTEDASTFYNIEWGHDITDTSSYTQFNSLEDAMASWNVFPKENIITSEE